MEIEAGQLIQYLIQTVILLLLILLMRMLRNGGSKNPGNGNPGKATVCIERGEKIQKHDTELENLIKDMDEEKQDRKQFHKDVRDNFSIVFKELRKINGASR